MEVIRDDNILIFKCPWCDDQITVLIKELNCKIFRHAIYKDSFKQINPHSSKNKCDKLLSNNKIFGCSKPFELIDFENNYKVQKCEYK